MSQLDDHLHRELLGEVATEADQLARGDLRSRARRQAPLLPGHLVERTVDQVQARVRGLGSLEPLLADAAITDVMVNGGGTVWIERHGELMRTDVVLDETAVLALIERVVAPLGLHVDRASPVVDARLPDGSRVHAIIRPLSIDGPCITIRRFGARRVPLSDCCPPGVDSLLRWLVRSRQNVVVSGGTGTGKTTLLNALAGEIPCTERVVTIEDAAELRLPGDHVIRLESRNANAEGVGEVRARELVRNALRMRPDRLVVGEVRGGEAIDMLQAMNTGHDGSLTTCHANAPSDALSRIETLVLMGDVALPLVAVREQIAAAVDVVVQMARRPGGGRRVIAVDEVQRRLGPDGGLHTEPLVSGARLTRLPARPVRGPTSEPPDPEWLS